MSSVIPTLTIPCGHFANDIVSAAASVEAANHVRFTDDCDLPASLEGVQYLLI